MIIRWNDQPEVTTGRELGEELKAVIPGMPLWLSIRIALASSSASEATQDVAVSIQLQDRSWINARVRAVSLLSSDDFAFVIINIVTAAALLALAAFASRLIARPLALLAARARDLSPDGTLRLDGLRSPREIREVAEALEAATARTRQLLQQRSLALGALSHDLLSPLARMRLRSEEIVDSAIRNRLLHDIDEMAEMVTDVLAYMRGSDGGGEAKVRISFVSLVQVVVDEFAEVGHSIEERGYQECTIVAQPTALKRAIRNIIANAIKYGRDPWIEVVLTGSKAVLSVGDSGPGLAHSDLQRVFEPFFRADQARASGEGSGLGLPTARAIAEAHGGQLDLESLQSVGTIARLSLPSLDG
ncbi:sensor histidine kinase [Pseudoroseomonas sp. WGS1072]|uniref:sensor histidine kinase n=1 Tax=Roseomonas sp. WGS1072 TaxID=3366816 RepID=UPI003BF02590